MAGGYVASPCSPFGGHGWTYLRRSARRSWSLAPVVAQRASLVRSVAHPLTRDQREELRRIGRRTWHYFDTVVTAAEHHLPPDNLQETPEIVIAPRTSPTNIGLYLLSVVAAADLGWIGRAEAVRRVGLTLGTVGSLPTFRGHLYNWYDTRELTVLTSAYVSPVDSGNLAGHLIGLSHACREWAEASDDPREQLAATAEEGLHDALSVLLEVVAEVAPDLPEETRARLDDATSRLADVSHGSEIADGVLASSRRPEPPPDGRWAPGGRLPRAPPPGLDGQCAGNGAQPSGDPRARRPAGRRPARACCRARRAG